jgi:hypothetical protein
MEFIFKKRDIRKIAQTLGAVPEEENNNQIRFVLNNQETGRRLALEIYNGIRIGKVTGNLISVFTDNAHIQLHFCTGYVTSDLLGEVTFIGEHHNRVSGLIIEKQAACSLYSNIDKKLLSGDFTKLGPEVMLAGIALSLTEYIL